MYKSLSEFVTKLEHKGELIRIKTLVDPELEISEITDRISKTPNGGKALLFENTGTNFSVLTNAFGSDKRMAMALGKNSLDDLAVEIEDIVKDLTSAKNSLSDKLSSLGSLKQLASIMPQKVKTGQCQEIIHKNPNLNILPVLKCWPNDGGRFITLPIVHTKDPKTGIRNVGMYRMQIFDEKLTGMHWHKHKVGARHYAEYKEINKKIPIAVALGGDPVYTYCATAPLPDNIDEYLLAGFIRKKKVKLVKCITQDIEVPADADIIIEGYVDPTEELIWEGPFGDHTGFYSLADYYPRFHVTCITHKKDAIYPATIVGIPPQEDAYLAKATERIFLPIIQKSVGPEVVDMNLPEAGVAHNYTILKIKSVYEGQALKIMNSLWGSGQMSLNKCMFVTDDLSLDITNYEEFTRKTLKNFNPEEDIYFTKGPMDVLDHASEKFTIGSKIGFDFSIKEPNNSSTQKTVDLDLSMLKNNFKEINELHSLLEKQIPILLFAIDKKEKIEVLAKKIIEKNNLSDFKILFFLDKTTDLKDLYTVAWLTGNNIAPKRDVRVLKSNIFGNNLLIIDSTTKSQTIDSFEREWPEIIVMNKETIQKVDENWNEYNIGKFINSPSIKFKKL
ncbi:MAG: menaquinone biosynthesis decarboxylase [Bacteroidales bacterium]|nr:menaquinone biosynthesis decarboxylase [Bacteroidales bacterium]